MSFQLRSILTLCAVIGLHLTALWALNAGLMHRVIERVFPVALLASAVELPVVPSTVDRPAPVPVQRPAKPVADAPAATNTEPARVESAPPRPAPLPTAPTAPDGAPSPPAMAVTAATATAVAVAALPGAQAVPAPARADPAPAGQPAARVAAAAPAPSKLELPSSDAAYLQNPPPPYPPISKRLREEGEVIVSVLIGVDGSAQRAELIRSSGFERLDRVAMETALRWRYVPGKRGGVPEPMRVEVPLQFRLEAAVR